MGLQEIRQRLEGGFTPFVIKMSDGREYPVPHREFIFLTKRWVVIADAEGYTNTIEPLHIVALQQQGALPVS